MSHGSRTTTDTNESLEALLAILGDYDGGEDLFDPRTNFDASHQVQNPETSAEMSRPATLPSLVRPASAIAHAADDSLANTCGEDRGNNDNDGDPDGESNRDDASVLSSSNSSTNTKGSPAMPSVEAPAKAGPKRLYKRQKDELIYLRSRVNELEERLKRLKSRSESEQNFHDSVSSSGSSEAVKTAKPSAQLAAVWEEVASRQSERRQQSEVENANLKEMLEEQIRVVRALEKLLRKRSSGNLLASDKSKKFKWNRMATKDEHATIFHGLLRQLEQKYSEIDAIFTHERFGSRGAIFRDIRVRTTDQDDNQQGENSMGEIYIEVMDSKILPFDLKATAAAVWLHMTRGESASVSLSRKTVELTDDTIARTFAADIKAGPMEAEVHGKQCVRRYSEDNRTIIVWNMLIEPQEVSGLFMGGLLVRQKAWMVLTPSTEDPTRATQLRARYVMTPDVYDDEMKDQGRKVGAITDFVMHSAHGNLNSSHEMIEDILLQTSLLKNPEA